MTPSKSNDDGRKRSKPADAANRGRKTGDTDKDLTRTGELSIEQIQRWRESRKSASKEGSGSDEDHGQPKAP